MQRIESNESFNARIDAEEAEARRIACPITTCEAQPGERCCTEVGQPRIRHCRRLWMAQKKRKLEEKKIVSA